MTIKNISNPNYVADSLTYLDPEWVSDSTLAQGVVTGLVSGIMACGNDFDTTIAYLAKLAKQKSIKIDLSRLPESWRETWAKYNG